MSVGRKVLKLEEDVKRLQQVINDLVAENYHLKMLLNNTDSSQIIKCQQEKPRHINF